MWGGKAKQKTDVAGDWSTTGTFLRKPAGGWLHEDRELQNGLSINYSVQYLGSLIVNTSMRTLQFNIRTQVTKEAILRLAENSGNVYLGKKKKVPKQVDKVLGGLDLRWAGEVNLSVSVDSLKISSEASGMILLNHALPSISFASGGDGATADYIGYVAKDPVHGRACHVFECPRSSQFVLATIGQAFELRYKLYLNSPRSNAQPVDPANSWDEEEWAANQRQQDRHTERGGLGGGRVMADVHHHPPPRIEEEEESRGIYSDIPDIPALPPPDSSPPPIPSARYTLAERPPTHTNGNARPHLENPYDTMEMSTTVRTPAPAVPGDRSSTAFGGKVVYEDANLVEVRNTAAVVPRHPQLRQQQQQQQQKRQQQQQQQQQQQHEEGGEYSTSFVSIRQSRISDDLNQIDLTPSATNHDYSNVNVPDEEEDSIVPPPVMSRVLSKSPSIERAKRPSPPDRVNKTPPLERKAPPARKQPLPKPPLLQHRGPEAANSDGAVAVDSQRASPRSPKTDYDSPFALKSKPPIKKKPTIVHQTRPGTYDDPDEIIAARKKPVKPKKPSRDDIVASAFNHTPGNSGGNSSEIYDLPEEGVYNTPDAVYDETGDLIGISGPSSPRPQPPLPPPPSSSVHAPFSPKFDDGIYMDANSSDLKTVAKSPARAEPDPLAALPQQKYFHGTMSRVEAEAMLMADGEFLIRESTKKTGQYVLTGMAASKPQHLLLMDKEGKVKSKDREFESVPHLIKHFVESKLPLVIGNSQVFLKKPVINAFINK